jgi:hypothetical protein
MTGSRVSRARITGTILSGHKDAAVEVPFDPAERFGLEPVALRRGRRGHRVRAIARTVRFESEIVPRSKRFWLVLPGSLLEKLRLEPGDRIEVTVEPLRATPAIRPRARAARPAAPAGPPAARAVNPTRAARRSSSGAARRGG